MATIAALFEHYHDADRALNDLYQMGYDSDDISIVVPKNLARESYDNDVNPAAETASQTAKTGAAFGGLAGLIAGLGVILVPGIGPVLSAGALGALLGSTAIGAGVGAATGGLLGGLVGLGIPEHEAKIYESGVKHGGILMTVIAEGDHIDKIQEILKRNHSIELNTRHSFWEKRGLEDFEQDVIHPTRDGED